MSILINGLEVRSCELNGDVEVTFKDLNEKGQYRLFTENKNTFLYDALTSEYESIRMLPLQFKDEYSSEALNNTIRELLPTWQMDLILELLNISGFELEEKLRKKLSRSIYYPLKIWVAKSEKTSVELLKYMFSSEVGYFIRENYADLLDSIISNPNFVFDWDLNNQISTRFNKVHYNTIVEKIQLLNPSSIHID